MKLCPLCKNSYEDWVEFCFQDGHPLTAAAAPIAAGTTTGAGSGGLAAGGVAAGGLAMGKGAAPPPPPVVPSQVQVASSVSSAPSLDPTGADWDAFDAPEPTLIRMAKLAAAKNQPAPVPAVPAAVTRPASGGSSPTAGPGGGGGPLMVDPGAPPGAPAGIGAPLGAVAPVRNRPDEPLSKARAVDLPVAGITAVPVEELEPSSTAEVLKEARGAAAATGSPERGVDSGGPTDRPVNGLAAASQAVAHAAGEPARVVPAPPRALPTSSAQPSASRGSESSGLDEFDFPSSGGPAGGARSSEDEKATVPMYAPQAADRDRASGRGRESADEDDDLSSAAPAAAGIGLAMIGAIGLGALVLVAGGIALWQMNKGDTRSETPVAAQPAPVKPPAPVVQPPAPPPEPPPEASPEGASPEGAVPGVDGSLTGNPPAGGPPEAGASPGSAGSAPFTSPTPPTSATSSTGTAPTTGTAPATGTPAPAGTGSKAPATPASGTGAKATTGSAGSKTPAGGTAAGSSPWGTTPTTPSTSAPVSPSASDNPWGSPEVTSTGVLRITSDPAGAAVYIDDKPRGSTPASIELPYGKHRVRLSLAGYKSESTDVSLNVKEMSVPFRLNSEESSGIINVFGPTGASVWIDDHDMGPLPVSVQVKEGAHTLKLVQADGKSCSSTRDVRFSGGGRPLAVNLSACQ